MIVRRTTRPFAAALLAAATAALTNAHAAPGVPTAQSADPPPAKPATDPPKTPPPPPPADPTPPKTGGETDAPPSLDEILGTGGDGGQPTPPAGDEPVTGSNGAGPNSSDAELDAALAEESMGDNFQRALEGMRRAAARLGERRTDLDTQRTQEEVMRRLEMLIDQAQQQQRQQQQQQQQSSRSQQQQQQDPGEQQSRAEQQQQQQQQQSSGTQPNGESLPPGFQEGPLDGDLSEAGSEWGSLPQRIREMLLQGRNERFSSLYERLTRSYYRRLAEEGSQ